MRQKSLEKEAGLSSCNLANHQGAVETLWLYIEEAFGSSIFTYLKGLRLVFFFSSLCTSWPKMFSVSHIHTNTRTHFLWGACEITSLYKVLLELDYRGWNSVREPHM